MQPGDIEVAGARISGDIPSVEPLHVLEFARSRQVNSAVFSEDGSSLYVHLHTSMLDVGEAVVAYLQWLGGALVVMVVLLALWHVRRVVRRPRAVGGLYCRKCNYDVGSQVDGPDGGTPGGGAARCPECGADLGRRPPVRGRAIRVRLAPALGAVVATAVVFVGLLTWRAVGSGWSYPSVEAADLAERAGAGSWLTRFIRSHDRYVEVDVRSGVVERVVAVRPRPSYERFTMGVGDEVLFRVGPDATLPVPGSGGLRRAMRIEVIDVGDGSTIAERRFAGTSAEGSFGARSVVAFEQNGDVALVALLEGDSHIVGAWNWREDTWRELATRRAEVDSATLPSAWSVSTDRELDPTVMVCASGFAETYATGAKAFDVFERRGDGDGWVRTGGRAVPQGPRVDGGQDSVMTSATPTVVMDGSAVLIGAGSVLGDLVGFGIPEFGTLGLLQPPGHVASPSECIARDDSSRMIAYPAIIGQCLLVRDVEERRWIAACRYGDRVAQRRFIGQLPVLSGDGRRAALVGFYGGSGVGAPVGGYPHSLIVWDLSDIDRAE